MFVQHASKQGRTRYTNDRPAREHMACARRGCTAVFLEAVNQVQVRLPYAPLLQVTASIATSLLLEFVPDMVASASTAGAVGATLRGALLVLLLVLLLPVMVSSCCSCTVNRHGYSSATGGRPVPLLACIVSVAMP